MYSYILKGNEMKKNNKPISLKMFFICIIIGIIIFASVYIFQVILTNYQLEKATIRFNITLKQIMEYSENNKFNIDTKEFEMLLNSNYELLKDSINNSIKTLGKYIIGITIPVIIPYFEIALVQLIPLPSRLYGIKICFTVDNPERM